MLCRTEHQKVFTPDYQVWKLLQRGVYCVWKLTVSSLNSMLLYVLRLMMTTPGTPSECIQTPPTTISLSPNTCAQWEYLKQTQEQWSSFWGNCWSMGKVVALESGSCKFNSSFLLLHMSKCCLPICFWEWLGERCNSVKCFERSVWLKRYRHAAMWRHTYKILPTIFLLEGGKKPPRYRWLTLGLPVNIPWFIFIFNIRFIFKS